VGRQGVALAGANGPTGTETTNAFTATNGSEYIIVVTGFSSAPSYTTTVTVH